MFYLSKYAWKRYKLVVYGCDNGWWREVVWTNCFVLWVHNYQRMNRLLVIFLIFAVLWMLGDRVFWLLFLLIPLLCFCLLWQWFGSLSSAIWIYFYYYCCCCYCCRCYYHHHHHYHYPYFYLSISILILIDVYVHLHVVAIIGGVFCVQTTKFKALLQSKKYIIVLGSKKKNKNINGVMNHLPCWLYWM